MEGRNKGSELLKAGLVASQLPRKCGSWVCKAEVGRTQEDHITRQRGALVLSGVPGGLYVTGGVGLGTSAETPGFINQNTGLQADD